MISEYAERFKVFILESPAGKTFANVGISIPLGIFSNTFVTEITVNGQLKWSESLKTTSLYVILGFSYLMYQYNRATFQHDNDLVNFKDDEFCRGYMRRACLPEAAKKWKELIRSGSGDELKKAKKSLEDLLS